MFRYLDISDIHFGHGLTPTKDIVRHLDQFFIKHDKLIKTLDVIFLGGDIYHRMLTVGSSDANDAADWLTRLARLCMDYRIKLRALEGTPSHDARQVALFETTIKRLNIDIDFKYISNLYIEHMVEHDKYVLYIPDEWHHKSEHTIKDIKTYYNKLGIDKTDVCIMHGAFKYQIPMVKLESNFDERAMLDLVRYFIHPGHIHNFSQYKRIVAEGSFDRLAHNEEGEKGAVYVTIDKKPSFDFLVNANATIFKSLIVSEEDNIDNFCEKHDQYLMSLQEADSTPHIRLVVSKQHPMNHALLELKKRYPYYNWTKKNTEELVIKNYSETLLEKQTVTSIHIHNGNIMELVENEMHQLGYLDKETRTSLMALDKLK